MCGNEKIRYVHIMEHPDLDENFDVGCVCAEKMSGDYEGPKRREAKLRNRAARRTRWLQRKWRVSAKGNSFLNVDGHNLGVHINKFKRWGYRIGSRFSTKTYATWSRGGDHQVILHSDRGGQFPRDDKHFLNNHLLVSSMSAVSPCGDNVLMIDRFHSPRMRQRLARQDMKR